jgi:hypothetical protein
MKIEWQAPFQLAWELGLFLLGSIVVLFIVFSSVLILYGLVKGFLTALSRARGKKAEVAPKKVEKKPVLKSVD